VSRIVISGAASWNRIVYLDKLPEPHPHMQFDIEDYETLGGTSAGKALNLVALGHDVLLHTLIGADADGARVRDALASAGVAIDGRASDVTERHLNLMTRAGERVSLYLSTPSAPRDRPGAELFRGADAVVLDLSPHSRDLIDAARASGAPIFTDLHDYDGESEFHRPFAEAADVIFMNADGVEDPHPLMRRLIGGGGAQIVVCTLGERGAIAYDRNGTLFEGTAPEVVVRDTNGAGDAFMAGFLHAHLEGADVPAALAGGARQAAVALATRHLHPALEVALGA
jgi:sugar/nucleoside kinase (ribokinase family)